MCPPVYQWVNEETGEVEEVIRSFDDYDVPPEKPGKWKRVIGTGHVVRGPNWGKKGHWGG